MTTEVKRKRTQVPPVSYQGARAWVSENWPRYWEVALYGLLIVIALGMRLWNLGSRAYNHDESLHAYYSWKLYDGQGYVHDPMMHGPFQFHFNALIFKVADFLGEAPVLSAFVDWGPNDFTGRLLPALFGTALVGLPYFLRGHIGRVGALLVALMLAFSPVLLFFSRFARNDIYIGFWTLAIVICIWRYLTERRRLYLYLLAGLLALSFATKEVTFITVALFLVYLDLLLAWEILAAVRRRREESAASSNPGTVAAEPATRRRKSAPPPAPPSRLPPDVWYLAGLYVLLVPFAWLIAITWPFIGRWRRDWGMTDLPPVGELLLVIGTLSAAQYAAAVQVLPFVENKGYYDTAGINEESVMKASVFLLIIAGAYFGVLWNARVWLLCGVVFYTIYVLFYTTFFTNMPGFWSGIWGSLDYWLEQQGVERGDQPGYYYLMILPMYEFLAVAFALVGLVYSLIRRRLFTLFLTFWAVGAMIGFAVAGEKMPWLTVHLSIPIILLAGALLNDLFQHISIHLPLRWPAAETIVLAAAGLGAFAMFVLWASFFTYLGVLAAILLGVAVAFIIARAWRLHGWLPATQAVAAAIGAALLVLTLRAGGLAAYDEGDYPNEMLSYADMSPDIPWVRDELVRYADASGLGKEYPIVVDNELAWPFVWYLRDFRNVQWVSDSMDPPLSGSIIVLKSPNQTLIDPYLEDYEAPVSIRHLWWFGDGPQFYENVTLGSFFGDLFKAQTWDTWRDYFLYRDTPWEPPPDDASVYFPKSIEQAGQAPIEPAPPIPTVTVEGQLVIGAPGAAPGQFAQPAGLDVDAQGNVYVADSNNDRIQKFGPDGTFIATLGAGGTKEASFNEPWGLAVDAAGNLYVADTWNHRIQKFDADLNLVATWGKPFINIGERAPNPDELFGPRDIALDVDGNILVTDTGNKRIVRFTPDGRPLGTFGMEGTQAGQFSEPLGIAVAANGDIYVADTWNRRVQRFDSGFNFLDEFLVRGWGSREISAKPYLAALPDGRLVLTNPVNARIEVYDQEGNAVASWDLPTQAGADKARPIGVAVAGQQFVFVSDGVGNRVYRLPLTEFGP